MNPPLGTIAQLGFVVRDLDRAVDHWVNHLRVGPFFRLNKVAPENFMHRGRREDPVFRGAMANSGPMQIEILQPDDTPTLWREFLDSGREGLQHVAYWTQEYDADLARMESEGYVLVDSGSLTQGRFAYFEAPTSDGYTIELSEQSPQKQLLFGAVRDAAEGWDGQDPVRVLQAPSGPSTPTD